MKGQKLVSLEDWVLKNEEICWDDESWILPTIRDLAKLLKSTPKLGDFIPCDLDGKPLEKPIEPKSYGMGMGYQHELYAKELEAYQEAEQRVLWDGEWEFTQDEIRFYIKYGDYFFCWDKREGYFDINVSMMFFRQSRWKYSYSDLANYQGFKNEGLIFKRDL